jgi:hypothetical protein
VSIIRKLHAPLIASCDEGESIYVPEQPSTPETVHHHHEHPAPKTDTVRLPAQPLHGTCVLDRAKVAHIPESWINVFHPFDADLLKTLCR